MISVSAGKKEKGDALVTVTRRQDDVSISIKSSVASLFSIAQEKVVTATLQEIKADELDIFIEDNHALDFVLAARVRAAVQRLRDLEGEL